MSWNWFGEFPEIHRTKKNYLILLIFLFLFCCCCCYSFNFINRPTYRPTNIIVCSKKSDYNCLHGQPQKARLSVVLVQNWMNEWTKRKHSVNRVTNKLITKSNFLKIDLNFQRQHTQKKRSLNRETYLLDMNWQFVISCPPFKLTIEKSHFCSFSSILKLAYCLQKTQSRKK